MRQHSHTERIGFLPGQCIGKFVPGNTSMPLDMRYDDILRLGKLPDFTIEFPDGRGTMPVHHFTIQYTHDIIAITVEIELMVSGIECTERKTSSMPFGFERTFDKSSSCDECKRSPSIKKNSGEPAIVILKATSINIASDDLRQTEHHRFHQDFWRS